VIRTLHDPERKDHAILLCDLELKLANENSETERLVIKTYLEKLDCLEQSGAVSSAEGGMSERFIEVADGRFDDKSSSSASSAENNSSSDEESIKPIVENASLAVKEPPPEPSCTVENQETVAELQQLLASLDTGEFVKAAVMHSHQMALTAGDNKVLASDLQRGHYSWKHDFERDVKAGGLIYKNKQVISNQRKVMSKLIKQIGANFFQGKSVMNISMPVTIFDSCSFLQRCAKTFCFAPKYLKLAGGCTDVIEQIKYCAAFYLGTFSMGFLMGTPRLPNTYFREAVQPCHR